VEQKSEESHSTWMREAIAEAELARGKTGDNPWVGCVIVAAGALLGRGHTQGPGEDHAEIAAYRQATARGLSVVGATLYSTLEPCSFHGRTPACSKAIVDRGIARVITGIRDPNPRVDGAGIRILLEGGLEVIEGICENEIRRQLGGWMLTHHPHELARHARTLLGVCTAAEVTEQLADIYAISQSEAKTILATLP
jgi:diaminohydroxyphosphoribosylaminopyrimidine deaminase/5-amino-6-(5-phosphoribosylamino)uracil reductase